MSFSNIKNQPINAQGVHLDPTTGKVTISGNTTVHNFGDTVASYFNSTDITKRIAEQKSTALSESVKFHLKKIQDNYIKEKPTKLTFYNTPLTKENKEKILYILNNVPSVTTIIINSNETCSRKECNELFTNTNNLINLKYCAPTTMHSSCSTGDFNSKINKTIISEEIDKIEGEYIKITTFNRNESVIETLNSVRVNLESCKKAIDELDKKASTLRLKNGTYPSKENIEYITSLIKNKNTLTEITFDYSFALGCIISNDSQNLIPDDVMSSTFRPLFNESNNISRVTIKLADDLEKKNIFSSVSGANKIKVNASISGSYSEHTFDRPMHIKTLEVIEKERALNELREKKKQKTTSTSSEALSYSDLKHQLKATNIKGEEFINALYSSHEAKRVSSNKVIVFINTLLSKIEKTEKQKALEHAIDKFITNKAEDNSSHFEKLGDMYFFYFNSILGYESILKKIRQYCTSESSPHTKQAINLVSKMLNSNIKYIFKVASSHADYKLESKLLDSDDISYLLPYPFNESTTYALKDFFEGIRNLKSSKYSKNIENESSYLEDQETIKDIACDLSTLIRNHYIDATLGKKILDYVLENINNHSVKATIYEKIISQLNASLYQ